MPGIDEVLGFLGGDEALPGVLPIHLHPAFDENAEKIFAAYDRELEVWHQAEFDAVPHRFDADDILEHAIAERGVVSAQVLD